MPQIRPSAWDTRRPSQKKIVERKGSWGEGKMTHFVRDESSVAGKKPERPNLHSHVKIFGAPRLKQ